MVVRPEDGGVIDGSTSGESKSASERLGGIPATIDITLSTLKRKMKVKNEK